MVKSNRFWGALKTSVAATKWVQIFVLFLVTFLFPIAEGILASLWTSAASDARTTTGWCLFIIALLHLILGLYVLLGKAVCPESVLAQAVEIEDELKSKDHELKRREKGYRLVRAAFERLNTQTCAIQLGGSAEAWCKGGFEAGLSPIVATLLQNVDTVLGVKSSVYSVEVYLINYLVPPCDPKTQNEIGLHFFYGASVSRAQALSLLTTQCSPAILGFQSGVPYQQPITSNKHLFYDGNAPKECVYFRHFATTPIYPACNPGGDTLGVLILTSMQDEEFAPDVLDTLGFFASIISNYLYSYEKCYYAHEEELKKAGRLHQGGPITLDDKLPDGVVGQKYIGKIQFSGGSAPYVCSVTSGELPSGLTLAPDGTISGTLNMAANFSFTVTVTDAKRASSARAYCVVVK